MGSVIGALIAVVVTAGLLAWLVATRLAGPPQSDEDGQSPTAADTTTGETFTRSIPAMITGNWEPADSSMAAMIADDAAALRAMGVNTVSVVAEYDMNAKKQATIRNKQTMITNLIAAKRAGFAVLVSPNFIGAGGENFRDNGVDITLEEFLQISEDLALEWAAIAETYQAEFLAPQNEFNGMLGNFIQDDEEKFRVAGAWHRRVLPKIRAVFDGQLMAKLDASHPALDVTGYDLVGITIHHREEPLATYRTRLATEYDTLKAVATKSDVRWLIAEAWMPYGGTYYSSTTTRTGESLDALQDDYFQIAADLYRAKADGRAAGFIFIAWNMEGMDVKDRPAADVLKSFFTELAQSA